MVTLDLAEGLLTAPVPDKGPTDRPRPEAADVLTGQHRLLTDALARKSAKSQRAIGMYLEAIRALERSDGSEALHVAAYEVREFMNELPKVLDLPVVNHQQLIDKIQSIAVIWVKRSSNSKCFKDGKWDGSIDGDLTGLLNKLREFFEWVEQYIPSRKTEAIALLTKLMPTSDSFPASLMEMRSDEWSDLLKYFNYYAHHNGVPDPADFRRKVERLRAFLLDHLEPRTFDDQGEIDRLIREAEAS